jgi:hypothetical protein
MIRLPHSQSLLIVLTALTLTLYACAGQTAAPAPLPALTQTPQPPPVATVSPPTAVPSPTPRPTATIAPDMLVYLNQALDFIQSKSYFSKNADWPALRQFAYRLAAGSSSPYVTSRAITAVNKKLGDTHAYLWNSSQLASLFAGPLDDQSLTPGVLLPGRIGLITIPGFLSDDQAKIDEFATRLQKEIRKIDSQNPCGWVLDLRANSGGNVWTMLAGVGPLLGEGTAAYFEDAAGNKTALVYRAGQALADDQQVVVVSGTAYVLKKQLPPVAVLTGPQTASAGELIAIVFRGRLDARSFGQPTGGYATAIENITLSDGSLLGITAGIDLDRNGNAYGLTPIPPDQFADLPGDGSVPPAALDWLLAQLACH